MTAVFPRSDAPALPSWMPPSRLGAFIFAGKVTLLRLRRLFQDLAAAPPRLARAEPIGLDQTIAESRTPLWSDESIAERAHEQGKVQNLRVAARALNGLIIPAGETFSFWRQVGPPHARRGFVSGRMLQQGCMVPATGGGLCQLSNALYDVALAADCRIVERHAHSRVVPGSAAALGRDATVAWNYVDLRFAPDRDLRVTVRLDADQLVVGLAGQGESSPVPPPDVALRTPIETTPRSCGTCDETGCFRYERARHASASISATRVFLVDEAWPEFLDYVLRARGPGDRLGLPFPGQRRKLPRYAWATDGFAQVGAAPASALRRAGALRVAGGQGAARRRAELDGADRIARSLARLITPEVRALTVAQSYLPFLWREGCLGGRSFDVLMSRLPMTALQSRLDLAAAAHPDHPTLADFRAEAWRVECETEALAAASQIVSPHAEIAALFPEQAVRLAWASPPPASRKTAQRPFIAFPGPTVARKGAYAVRDAAIALDLEVMPLGSEIEGPEFWRGVRLAPPGDWRDAMAVVQPAVVEDQPRRLLAALASGIPVIASAACGIDPQVGLTLIAPDDPAALGAALRGALKLKPTPPAASASDRDHAHS